MLKKLVYREFLKIMKLDLSQVWDSLNADNKVSLYINWIDLATGEESVRIFNKNQ